jgi:hypothetical protein
LLRFGRFQSLNDYLDRFWQIGVLFGVDAFELLSQAAVPRPQRITEAGCVYTTATFLDELVNRHWLSEDFPDADRHFFKACCRF